MPFSDVEAVNVCVGLYVIDEIVNSIRQVEEAKTVFVVRVKSDRKAVHHG
jgi:hypothetical protein